MSVKETKKCLPLQVLLYLAIVVQLVAALILGSKLLEMNVLPVMYIVIAGVIVFVFNVIAYFCGNRWWSALIMLVLSVILTAVIIYAIIAVHKVDDTVQQVTDNPNEVVTQMTILVLKDSEVAHVTDLSQYTVGYVNDEDYEYAQKLLDEIKESTGDINMYEFRDRLSMVKALYSKTINAIVINEAYIEMLAELEEYKNIKTDTKSVYSSDIKGYIDLVPEEESKEEVKEHVTNLDAFVVYFSGIDRFGHVSARSRSDVNILAVINTKTKHIQLINTPRDYFVPFPVTNGVKDKLTHAGLYGINNSIGTLNALYGINIDFYVRMNFSGFENIIDALGGIDVYSEYDFTVEPIKHYVKGMNHLSGIEALAFARERHAFAAGDFQRGRNQMAVIKAMINKVSSKEMLYNYAEVLDSIADSFQTNMTSEDIYSLVKIMLADSREWVIEDFTVTGNGSTQITYSMPGQPVYVLVPDYSTVEAAKSKIQSVLQER